MVTRSAAIATSIEPEGYQSVLGWRDLRARGIGYAGVRGQLDGGRWQRVGRAIVLHNGPLSVADQRAAALVNCGPHAVLTSFTALAVAGLTGWTRAEVHVLVPVGTTAPRDLGFPLVLHRTARWAAVRATASQTHTAAQAAILAASSFRRERSGCGVLAATVQQRLARADQLGSELTASLRTRHRSALLLAVADIAMGADALSEIDFGRLCRRYHLPAPTRQAVRIERSGRRRYLDAEWRLPDGTRLGAEIDGAVHLAPRRWWEDQLRSNEIVIAGTTLLRFPSVVVRGEPALVADQLRRALRLASGS